MRKRILSVLLAVTMVMSLAGCGSSPAQPAQDQTDDAAAEQVADASQEQEETKEQDEAKPVETKNLNMAYQYGLAYAPLAVMQDQKLIEKKYEELTGGQVNVVWNQMSSGPDINTGIASGSIDVGFMGVAPAITGVMKNVGYKIFTNLSGQEHGLMTNDASLASLGDLVGSDKQIALVNIGSIQHIILAKTLAANGFDPHALDANIIAMKHPDGMTALQSSNVACHLTSNPYIYMERESGDFTELKEVSDVWSADQSFIVGVAATSLNADEPELYQALCEAVAEAIDYINGNMEEAAKLTCELDGNTVEDELKYMKLGNYSVETKGVFDLATFMAENDFIESAPASYNDLVFDNVSGN